MMYTTWGSVMGCCGHLHKSIEAANRCIDRLTIDRDRGQYTDRGVREVSSRADLRSYDTTTGPGKIP